MNSKNMFDIVKHHQNEKKEKNFFYELASFWKNPVVIVLPMLGVAINILEQLRLLLVDIHGII